LKFNFEIRYTKGKDKSFGTYYISSVDNTPFIAQGKSKDDCTKQTFDMIAGFMEAFPDYKKMFKKYGILK
jgi:inorganic pyrophosphatase